MKLALAQLNYTIGDINGNTAKIIDAVERAKAEGADVVVFAEQAVSGTPAFDLLRKTTFLELCEDALEQIATHCDSIVAIVGSPLLSIDGPMSAAVVMQDGRISHCVTKKHITARREMGFLNPGTGIETIFIAGEKVALVVGDDFRRIRNFPRTAQTIININARRYGKGVLSRRYSTIHNVSFIQSKTVVFVNQGDTPKKMKQENVDKAARIARTTDLNIVVAGETSLRVRKGFKTCGENQDRATIDLFGLQKDLIRKVAASGKPTILVVVTGRPNSLVWEDENLPAILYAWEPGMLGGKAVAEILYGEVNPSAKLAITIPRHEGQIQMYYNQKKSIKRYRLVDMSTKPLYEFGYGLSYTTYEYSDLKLSASEIKVNENIEATVTIKNTGARDGVEIAQLYIRDCYSDVTRPVKELRGFERVALKAGESKSIKFTLTPEHLRYYNLDMERVVEPGTFQVMVGGSSRDKDLLTAEFEVK